MFYYAHCICICVCICICKCVWLRFHCVQARNKGKRHVVVVRLLLSIKVIMLVPSIGAHSCLSSCFSYSFMPFFFSVRMFFPFLHNVVKYKTPPIFHQLISLKNNHRNQTSNSIYWYSSAFFNVRN